MAEPTQRRGPIQAEFTGPGSGMYQLPTGVGHNTHDPRSQRHKLPAWSFGIKHGKFVEDASPGPVHYPDVTVTRSGKDGTPHYSLYSRPRDPRTFQPPGPGAYSPEKAGRSSCPQAPLYSFGARNRLRRSDKNPAPNNYTLPSLLGETVESGKAQAARYSLRGRSSVGEFSEDLQKTPGPGTYQTTDPSTFKNRQPLYSLGAKRELPGDGTRKPGPGAHSPEKTFIHKSKAPASSFGVRHSEYLTPLIVDVGF